MLSTATSYHYQKYPQQLTLIFLVTNATVVDDIVTRNFHLFATIPYYNLMTTNATMYSYFSTTAAYS